MCKFSYSFVLTDPQMISGIKYDTNFYSSEFLEKARPHRPNGDRAGQKLKDQLGSSIISLIFDPKLFLEIVFKIIGCYPANYPDFVSVRHYLLSVNSYCIA